MVKFEKGIPMPAQRRKVDIDPFLRAEIGDSWTVEDHYASSVYGLCGVMKRRHGKTFKAFQEKGDPWINEGSVVRVWRVS